MLDLQSTACIEKSSYIASGINPLSEGQGWLDNIEAPLREVGKVDDWLFQRQLSDAKIRASILNNTMSQDWDIMRRSRYRNCGQHRLLKDAETGQPWVEKHFCNNATYCPNCQRIQAKKKRLSLEKDIPYIEQLNHERVQRILTVVSSVQEDIAHVRQGMDNTPTYGEVGSTKRYYREVLATAILLLKTVQEDMRLKEIRVALNGAREAIRGKGFNSVLVCHFLDEAKHFLEDQINYKWQHSTLSVRTKEDKGRAINVLKKCWPAARRSMFSGADVAGFESIEMEGAAHIHVIFLGPWINERKLKEMWRELTAAEGLESFQVKVREVYDKDGNGLEKALLEGVKYAVKMSDKSVERVFEFANALKGKKRFQRWGNFRGLGQRKKRLAPIIGKYTAADGGVDIIRDSRPVRDGRIHEYVDILN